MTRAPAAALLLVVAACDPRLYEPRAAATPPPAPSSSTPATESAPPPVNPFSALAMLSKPQEPGPFDEPNQVLVAGKPYAAVLELRGRVVELDAPFDLSLATLTGGRTDATALRALTLRLRQLDGDKDVASVLLRLDSLSMSMAVAEELRAVLGSLTKPVFCHAEGLENAAMLVATSCDTLSLEPGGLVLVNGPAVVPLYFKGLLDKLDLQADYLHMGAYKGAAEPMTRDAPSPEMRQTYADLLDGAYERLITGLADGRKVAREKAVGWVDTGLFTADAARAAGLVDSVVTFPAIRDEAGGGAWKKVKVKESKGGMDDLFSLVGLKPRARVKGPHVALLYAVGEVVDGRGSVAGAFEQIASGRLAPAVRAAAADPDVKVIVLRVDSPGGSALASEVIWAALSEAVKTKPVVVSMGSLAASGGYYISTPASRVFAQPDTLTGSIGVVGGKIVIGKGLARIGVHAEEIGRGKRALLGSSMRLWSDDERAAIRGLMEGTYVLFKSRVAAGRKLTAEAVEPLAQGRVWTGAQAKERGLVDELGGLEQALAFARQAAQLPDDAPVDVYPGEPSLLDLLGGLGGGVRLSLALDALLPPMIAERFGAELHAALRLVDSFAGDPVRAVAFLPTVR